MYMLYIINPHPFARQVSQPVLPAISEAMLYGSHAIACTTLLPGGGHGATENSSYELQKGTYWI